MLALLSLLTTSSDVRAPEPATNFSTLSAHGRGISPSVATQEIALLIAKALTDSKFRRSRLDGDLKAGIERVVNSVGWPKKLPSEIDANEKENVDGIDASFLPLSYNAARGLVYAAEDVLLARTQVIAYGKLYPLGKNGSQIDIPKSAEPNYGWQLSAVWPWADGSKAGHFSLGGLEIQAQVFPGTGLKQALYFQMWKKVKRKATGGSDDSHQT